MCRAAKVVGSSFLLVFSLAYVSSKDCMARFLVKDTVKLRYI
jgi:hypothetical protein